MEQRTLKVLEAVVDEYIKTGLPIGSKALVEHLSLNVSSATVRNEMSLLEKEGFLEHPHTSAGRIPTFSGYKLYIDKILAKNVLQSDEQAQIDEIFAGMDGYTDDAIVESAAHALAEVTKCAIVSTTLTNKFAVITKVEVIPTGKRMYVLLLITSSGNVKNRICRLSFDLTNEQMDFFKTFAEDNIMGQNVEQISDDFINNLSAALGNYILSLSPLLKAVADISAEMTTDEVTFDGEANLFACKEIESNDIAKIIANKNEFSALLDNAFSGINVLFGGDTFVATNTSLITGAFNKGDKRAGSFGVIGPLRVDYKKLIPYIDYFTKKVTSLLSSSTEDAELRMLKEENKTD